MDVNCFTKIHGKAYTYTRGCRCSECCEANTVAARKARLARRMRSCTDHRWRRHTHLQEICGICGVTKRMERAAA